MTVRSPEDANHPVLLPVLPNCLPITITHHLH